MDTKNVVSYAIGLGLLGLSIFVISKAWKFGQN